MTTRDDFDRTLGAWLVDNRPTTAPDSLLDATLERIANTQRRRQWLIADRWTWSTRVRQWSSALRVTIAVATIALLVVIIAAAVILTGAPRPAPPFGLTSPGYITGDTAEGIVVARLDGSDRHVLVAADGQSISPTWSRDGLTLAFWHRRSAGDPWDLVAIDVDGGNRRILAEGITLRERETTLNQPSNLSWSPDSRQIAYAADTNGGTAIFVVDGQQAGPRQITDPELEAIDPAWSPDGSVIAFDSDATTTVHVVRPNGGGERQLADLEALKDVVLWPDWSPDGRLLAVSAAVDNQLDVFTVSADGSSVTNVSHDPSNEYSPSWSPDGSRLAWAREPADASARAWVVVSSRDGTRVVELRVPADLAPPVWSPDGTRVYSYVANEAGAFFQLIVLDPDGVAPVVRIPVEGNVGNGSWQRRP